jgi:hypothetical protein
MPEKPPHPAPPTPHVFHYTVDGEDQQTTEHQLTPRQILTNAGLDPAERCLVEVHGKDQNKLTDLDAPVHIHEGQVFVTVNCGPKPVS